MKELNIGEQKVRVRATPLALLYYKQEFKSDLIGDLTKLAAIKKNVVGQPKDQSEGKDKDSEDKDKDYIDISKLDTVALLQLVWAMAKADAHPEKFPSFIEWLSSLDGFDFSDSALLTAALEEAADGFFRRGKQQQIKK